MKRKIIALFTLIVILACAFVSCSLGATPTADELVEKAEKALADNPHKIALVLKTSEKLGGEKYEDDPTEIQFYEDGNNYAIKVSGMAEIDIRCVGNVVYYNMSSELMPIKAKINVTDAQREEIWNEYNQYSALKPSDFGEFKVEEKGGKFVISSSEISTETLNKIAEENGGGEIQISISDAAFKATVADGKYESSWYKVTMDYPEEEGLNYSITMEVSMSYQYDGLSAITAPDGADAYMEVDYDMIF